jgi:hypothetical protein
MPTLVETPGADTANTFATVAEFEAYRDTRLPANDDVTAADDALITIALIQACRILEDCFDWTGAATDDVQALTWPRKAMLTRNGFAIANTVIPSGLKNAQCELAFHLISGEDLLADDDAAKNNILGVNAGDVSVRFQRENTSTNIGMDLIMRRMTNEFAYLSNEIPGEVRRLLVTSWYNQPTIFRPLLFKAF